MPGEEERSPRPASGGRRWPLVGWMVALSVALEGAELLAAPYLRLVVTPPLVAVVLLAAALLAAFGAGAGLWLGPSLGWDVLGLRGWRSSVALAAWTGALLGVAQGVFAARVLGALGLTLSLPPVWLGAIGGVAGAFREEIIYRMGLMTLLAWLGARLFRQARPGTAIAWAANVLTAIAFGAQHFSSDAAQVSGHISPAAFALLIIAYHGLAGLLFGWLYWKRGGLAAMAGHLSTDLVITLITAIPGFIV